MNKKTNYAPDVDGLRTVAVIPVILFHAGFISIGGIPIAPGGYVGVDIFFVISGFLISKIIYSEISNNAFSFTSFYARRIRRIFPALFAVYLACLAFVAFFGLLNEAAQLRNSTIASILIVSNIYFANLAGYFDAALQNNPLLHTWSLSIEEQFYVLFPILIFAIHRLPSSIRVGTLVAVLAASFVASLYLTQAYPQWAYYSVISRAWELGLGSLLAIIRPIPKARWNAELSGLVGIAMIVFSIMSYDKATAFPGAAAIWPTLGTALVIYSGLGTHKGAVTRFLSLGLLRGIGLISYSLYLWHWPVLVFGRQLGYTSKLEVIAQLVLIFVLSCLSWLLIEQPFRRGYKTVSTKTVVRSGLVAMAATCLVALLVVPVNTVLRSPNERVQAIAAFDASETLGAMQEGLCFLTSRSNDLSYFDDNACLTMAADKPNILLIGDSHAAQLTQALKDTNPQANILQATASGCLPLIGTEGADYCVEMWEKITTSILPENHFDVIVMSAFWRENTSKPALETARMLGEYADKVVIVGPNHAVDGPFPRILALSEVQNKPEIIVKAAAKYTDRVYGVDEAFAQLAPYPQNISYLSYVKEMCENGCPNYSSTGEPTLIDANHLSLSAATDFLHQAGVLVQAAE